MKFIVEREKEIINGNCCYTPQDTTLKRSSSVVQDLPVRDLGNRNDNHVYMFYIIYR